MILSDMRKRSNEFAGLPKKQIPKYGSGMMQNNLKDSENRRKDIMN